MDDHGLVSLLNTLSMSFTEEKLLNIPSEELAVGSNMCNRSLIGKFLAQEEVIINNGLKTGMIIAWKSHFSSINLRKNVNQFIFELKDKLNQTMEDGPWCFDENLLVLSKWRDDWESYKFFFDEYEFWVHIVRLPLKCCTGSVGMRLISLCEGCKKAQIREEEVSGKHFSGYKFGATTMMKMSMLVSAVFFVVLTMSDGDDTLETTTAAKKEKLSLHTELIMGGASVMFRKFLQYVHHYSHFLWWEFLCIIFHKDIVNMSVYFNV